MANDQRLRGATTQQIEYWMLVHQVAELFVDGQGRELAAACGWGEQNVHDAICVIHAIAHATMDALGFVPWPDCPLGDGTEAAEAAGLHVVIEVHD